MPKSAYIRPTCIRSMGSSSKKMADLRPKFREGYGDGVPVVVCDGESPLHSTRTTSNAGEGEQVSQISYVWEKLRNA